MAHRLAQARTKSQFSRLRYKPASDENRDIPPWMDAALRRAVHPDPAKRYDSLSEFVFDLRHPNQNYVNASAPPLIERNPNLFWKCTTAVLALIVIILLASRH